MRPRYSAQTTVSNNFDVISFCAALADLIDRQEAATKYCSDLEAEVMRRIADLVRPTDPEAKGIEDARIEAELGVPEAEERSDALWDETFDGLDQVPGLRPVSGEKSAENPDGELAEVLVEQLQSAADLFDFCAKVGEKACIRVMSAAAALCSDEDESSDRSAA